MASGSQSDDVRDFEDIEVNVARYPLWKHVTKLVPPKSSNARGGNARFICHFCENEYPGSYSRVRAHLLKIKDKGVAVCSKMTYDVLEHLRREDHEASEAGKKTAPSNKLVRLPPFDDSSSAPSSKKRNTKQSDIAASFNAETRHIADSHIARLFYTAGLPFNVARNPYFREAFKSYTPLQCLAHSLNPRYYSTTWLNENPSRVSPHKDNEINTERNKCFRKFFTEPEDLRKIKQQFADFSLFMGGYEDPDSIEDRAHFEPKQWWGTYGGSTPELRDLALRLLGHPASSSCCERNWSTYSFIHSMKRNKLAPERAEDLVNVHNNLRLLSRNSSDYKSGPSRMWDIAGDGTESFAGASFLEGAQLTLDEPEFEREILEGEE